MTQPHPRFENILNFRDISSLTSDKKAVGNGSIRPGRIYRSARPDLASDADQQQLREAYNIRTILDLRTPTEHMDAVSLARQRGLIAAEDTSLASIAGTNRVLINFNGRNFSRALMAKLSYLQQAHLILLYACGWRKEAIAVLARNVMAPRGLSGLAADSLAHCKDEVKAVFDLLAQESTYPLLIHCTQGKDRTGLVVLLVELLVGLGIDAIEQDYLESESELEPERQARTREVLSVGLPESFAHCQPDWARAVCETIQEDHGGIANYLSSCDITIAQQGIVRGMLSTY